MTPPDPGPESGTRAQEGPESGRSGGAQEDPETRRASGPQEDPRGRTLFLAAAAVTLLLDAVTKLAVYHLLPLNGRPRPVLGQLLRWNHIHNSGAAFGLFPGNRFFFVAVSAISAAVILYVVLTHRYRSALVLAGFGMILGGAVGNLANRIWLGVVVDFIDMGIGRLRWPIFNVADMGVTLGVVVLGLGLLREDRIGGEAGQEAEEAPEEPAAPGHA